MQGCKPRNAAHETGSEEHAEEVGRAGLDVHENTLEMDPKTII